MWLPLPWPRRRPPRDVWHSSFHPGISHPEFFSADIPSEHLTSRILPRRHFTRVSHIRNSSPPTFHPGISHQEFFLADIPPGHLTSGILPRRHSTRTSHIQNSSPPSFHQNISHPEFCPADVPPFSSSLEHFLEVPKISFSINFAAIFFSTCNFNNFHDFKISVNLFS